jgi:hypothetical protein
MKINVNLLSFFSKDELNRLAAEAGLVNRTSAINGFNFGLTFTLGLLNTTDTTLKQLAAFLNNTCNKSISPQALDQRINTAATNFLKTCFSKAVKISLSKLQIPNELMSFLSHIYIIDSTNFELHPSLKEIFKGNAGAASLASMRIQFIYDYLTGDCYVEIGDVRTSDPKTLYDIVSSNKLDTSGNSLYLQDLGYFSVTTFITMSDAKAFFISKLKFRTKVFDLNGQEIDILKLLRRKLKSIDLVVKIGDLTCRLTGTKLSKTITDQRIQTANVDAKKKRGKTISKEYQLFLSYGLFITNLPDSFTPISTYTVYRLRWQIELIFKSWKSILEIHRIHSAKIARIFCEVFGKLIISVIVSGIVGQAQLETNMHFSHYQALQYFKSIATNWALKIVLGISQHAAFIKRAVHQLVRFCRKRKQKTRPRIEDLLCSLSTTGQVSQKKCA